MQAPFASLAASWKRDRPCRVEAQRRRTGRIRRRSADGIHCAESFILFCWNFFGAIYRNLAQFTSDGFKPNWLENREFRGLRGPSQ
jgi:hypothetical protein